MPSIRGGLPLLLVLGCKGKAEDTSATAATGTTTTTGGATSGTATTSPAWAPDIYCPGDPSGVCDDAAGTLHVGAGAVDITPACFESWEDPDENGEWDWNSEAFLDCGCDRLCAGDDGYPGPDEGEEDGEFQASWMAGFHTGRPAQGSHDPLWARALVLDQGETRIAFVVVDLVGWFNDEIDLTREELAAAGLDVDYLMVSATHNHEGPDTMGIWGKTATQTGVLPEYHAQVRTATVEAVAQAVAGLTEVASMTVGEVDIRDYSDQGARGFLRDSRDPNILDPAVGGAAFRDASGAVIASLGHFGNHPEAMADENVQITSDFADPMRRTMETGSSWDAYDRDGLGGTAIYVNGTVGGLMTPLGITVTDPDGGEWREYTFERNEVMGALMGEMALDAIEGGTEDTAPTIEVAAHSFLLPVDNWGFQAMFMVGIIDRETYDWDESQAIDDDNVPKVRTEVAVLRIGDLEMVTVPGELLPELAIGGFDGSYTDSPDTEIIDENNENPPDLSQAPEGPYLLEHLTTTYRWVIGLGNDELGYIVPPYNFQLSETLPWFEQAPGDHYEETNSLGPQTAPIYLEEAEKLIGWMNAQ